jgi:hypothetical protein
VGLDVLETAWHEDKHQDDVQREDQPRAPVEDGREGQHQAFLPGLHQDHARQRECGRDHQRQLEFLLDLLGQLALDALVAEKAAGHVMGRTVPEALGACPVGWVGGPVVFLVGHQGGIRP